MKKKYTIFLQYNSKLYKGGEIEIKNDGSLYLLLPGNSKARTGHNNLRKISIHSSGQINYETPDCHKVYISPLYNGIETTPIVGVYIPNLEFLDSISKINTTSECIPININVNENICISFILSSTNILKENAIAINITSNLFMNIFFEQGKFNNQCKDKVRWVYLKNGDYDGPSIDKFEAKRRYYNVLYGNSHFKIIGPDEDGRIELCFEVVMHNAPLLYLELDNPDQYIVPIEGSCIHLVFVIKNRKRGNNIVKNPQYIKIRKAFVSCEPGIEETEEGRKMIKFDKVWK